MQFESFKNRLEDLQQPLLLRLGTILQGRLAADLEPQPKELRLFKELRLLKKLQLLKAL